jgi:hypothetical protein
VGGLLAQVGMSGVVFAPLLLIGAVCGVFVLVVLVIGLTACGERGPRVLRVGPLPAAAFVAGCVGGCAARGPRSEVPRTLLPYAVALSVAAVSVRFSASRQPVGRGGRPGG